LDIVELPPVRRPRRALTTLALGLGLGLSELKLLLAELPAQLALELSPAQARALSEALSAQGARVFHQDEPDSASPCDRHPKLGACRLCDGCGVSGCPVCVVPSGKQRRCPRCRERYRRRRAFFLVRVSVLLTILVAVLLWALGDLLSRRARNQWQGTLQVAVVVLLHGDVDPASIGALRQRLPALQDVLDREFRRYRSGPAPFHFVLHGPTPAGAPPRPPEVDETWPTVLHAYRQWRYLSPIDERLGLDGADWHSRVYLVARAPRDARVQVVEGYGQEGGRIGVVEVELAPSMVDPVLAVATHELFHNLGAVDKYDAAGRTLLPAGLARPEQRPTLPQRRVEVMARGRPLADGSEAQLDDLHELGVGPATAAEIGWANTDSSDGS
jgi:hypothetical protein